MCYSHHYFSKEMFNVPIMAADNLCKGGSTLNSNVNIPSQFLVNEFGIEEWVSQNEHGFIKK